MKGMTLYEGPSALGPHPIVVLATNTHHVSANAKTGDAVQVYIELRDQHPHEARVAGHDQSICGGCSLRPYLQSEDGTCYVPGYMLSQPWSRWKERPDLYPTDSLQHLRTYKPVRVGAYGDMAAVPHALEFWSDQLKGHEWLAYTGQWRTQPLQSLAMASVQSAQEQQEAEALGYRTYRRYQGALSLLNMEVECPFPRVQCRTCLLCNGKGKQDRRKHIAVMDAAQKRRTHVA